MSEKLEAYQMLVTGGLINPQDQTTREYILDTLGLTDMDLSDHLDYTKAERDLQKLISGVQPMESPFQKWDIYLHTIADYSKTEEFEALDPIARNGILMYAQYISDKLTMVQGGLPGPGNPPGMTGAPPVPGGPPAPGPHMALPLGKDSKGGIGGQSPSHILGKTPGTGASTDQVQMASIREGANVVPNNPGPSL